jgi:hypothetical protein
VDGGGGDAGASWMTRVGMGNLLGRVLVRQ